MIKSNNPHLAGGEKHRNCFSVFSCVMFYAPSLVCNIVICHVDTCLQCLYPFVIPSAWRLQVAAA